MDRRSFLGVATVGLIPLHVIGSTMIEGVCKKGKPNEWCRYFAEDKENVPVCLKLAPKYRKIIDEEVAEFQKLGVKNLSVPLGDNCLGCAPPLSTAIESADIEGSYDLGNGWEVLK